jgi:hypothetical protein
MTRDPIRVRLGRLIQRFGRWVAHGGRPHEWQTVKEKSVEGKFMYFETPHAYCVNCTMEANADMVVRHGGLSGRCPK